MSRRLTASVSVLLLASISVAAPVNARGLFHPEFEFAPEPFDNHRERFFPPGRVSIQFSTSFSGQDRLRDRLDAMHTIQVIGDSGGIFLDHEPSEGYIWDIRNFENGVLRWTSIYVVDGEPLVFPDVNGIALTLGWTEVQQTDFDVSGQFRLVGENGDIGFLDFDNDNIALDPFGGLSILATDDAFVAGTPGATFPGIALNLKSSSFVLQVKLRQGFYSDLVVGIRSDTFGLVNVVPIPAAMWLFASGIGVLGWMRRKTQSKHSF